MSFAFIGGSSCLHFVNCRLLWSKLPCVEWTGLAMASADTTSHTPPLSPRLRATALRLFCKCRLVPKSCLIRIAHQRRISPQPILFSRSGWASTNEAGGRVLIPDLCSLPLRQKARPLRASHRSYVSLFPCSLVPLVPWSLLSETTPRPPRPSNDQEELCPNSKALHSQH